MRRVEDAIRPALGAVVMASGVVSIDLYSDHRAVLSALTLWFAVGVWLLLVVVVLGVRLAIERDRFAREARFRALPFWSRPGGGRVARWSGGSVVGRRVESRRERADSCVGGGHGCW